MRAAISLTNIFRSLVVLTLAVQIATPVIRFTFYPLPVKHDDWFDHWHFAGKMAILMTLVVAYFASDIALLFFKWWARIIYTISVIAVWIVTIDSLGDQRPPVFFYSDGVETISEIGVIALMWASPLVARFRKPPSIEHQPVTHLRELIFQWPQCGRVALASICSVLVASVCVLPPTVGVFVARLAIKPDSTESMQYWPVRFAIFDLAIREVLQSLAFWVLISFVLFPALRFGLRLPFLWRRWTSVAMGWAVPFLLLLAAEALSPQFTPLEFFITPICCGIPAALVFGEIVGYRQRTSASDINPRHAGQWVAVGLSALCVLILAAIGQQAWSAAALAFPVKAEWQYRLRHPTWPVWCSNMTNFRLFPRLDPTVHDDNAICKTFAEKGDAVAQYVLSAGTYGPVEPVERLAWLTKSAEQDYGPAATALGSMLGPFSKDQGVPKNTEKAAQWELRAAVLGDTVASLMVAVYYAKGDRGLPLDNLESLMWREIAFRRKDGLLRQEGLRDNYEKFAATMPSDVVAAAHRRAEEFLATH